MITLRDLVLLMGDALLIAMFACRTPGPKPASPLAQEATARRMAGDQAVRAKCTGR
jgi:hypothetical protein